MVMFPLSASTFSLKLRTIVESSAIPVALSAGTDELSVGEALLSVLYKVSTSAELNSVDHNRNSSADPVNVVPSAQSINCLPRTKPVFCILKTLDVEFELTKEPSIYTFLLLLPFHVNTY